MKGKALFKMGTIGGLLLFFVFMCSGVGASKPADYKARMVELIAGLHDYAKKQNPSFQLMGNNGLALFMPEEGYPREEAERLLGCVDGIFMEEYNFGWEMKDGERTPLSVRREIDVYLAMPRERSIPILNVDYTGDAAAVHRLSKKHKMIGFAADSRQLDTIPKSSEKPYNENSKTIESLREVENFLLLLNPERFKSKKDYLSRLKNSNCDLLILDSTFNGAPLTKAEVELLKRKKNGAARLVFAYMSVGEAEEYRPYWRQSWQERRPDWMAAENEDWQGNYKVKYWSREWKEILYGSPASCLDMVLAQGFDGAFLDVIDAFAYFMELTD